MHWLAIMMPDQVKQSRAEFAASPRLRYHAKCPGLALNTQSVINSVLEKRESLTLYEKTLQRTPLPHR